MKSKRKPVGTTEMAYRRNKKLIDSTHPTMSQHSSKDLFKKQVESKMISDGVSEKEAVKSILNSRQAKLDPAEYEARWLHKALTEDLTNTEKSRIYRKKISLKFENMKFLGNDKNKKIYSDGEECTLDAEYQTNRGVLGIYYAPGYKRRVITLDGNIISE